jgi:cyclopropane fatty-acyl-phospholipid synthase-like methyltransferase
VSITPSELRDFYENKTQSILRRYGPGPRVHYHTGLLDDEYAENANPDQLRELLVRSQENLLRYAAKLWQIDSLAGREILDVGCGLGGGSLFFAQEFAARVTALTIIPSHAELVRQFAAQAGVSELITPMIADATEVLGEHRFDAAIAIDSSSSFPRVPWFSRLAALLRPRRHVFIADCFLVDEQYREPFNSHWCAQIGTLNEYLEAAHAAGFHEESIEDVSIAAARFWSLSLSLMQSEERDLDASASARMRASRRMHTMVRDGLANGGLRYLLLSIDDPTCSEGAIVLPQKRT